MYLADYLHRFSPVQTWLPPWGLSGCIRAVLGRQTDIPTTTEAQRWGHYPANPICSINFLFEGDIEILKTDLQRNLDAPRQRIPTLSVSGPQITPKTVYYPRGMHSIMVILYPDAWWALTGVPPHSLSAQTVDAHDVMPPALLAACQRMWLGGDDQLRVQRFFEDLQPLWRQRADDKQRGSWHSPTWAQTLAPWMESLAMRAAATGCGRSLRQSERRIKQWTGWSLRRLQGSARGEAAFFAVMDALLEDGERVDWARIALDNGFYDQSHLIRETRRLTGFSPETLRHGFDTDDAFWAYRAWAQLAGYKVPQEATAMA